MALFIHNVKSLKLSIKSAPSSLEQKRNWINNYVAPTLKILAMADSYLEEEHLKESIAKACLKPKHEAILEDYLRSIKEYRKSCKT